MFAPKGFFIISLIIGVADAFTVSSDAMSIRISRAEGSSRLHMMEDNRQKQVEHANRREYIASQLKFLAALTTTSVATTNSANAFDNKISDKYDDRPKRRGPQPKDLNVGKRKDMVGEEYIGLKNCGPSPNCFCSTDDAEDDPDHSIPAWVWPSNLDQQQAFSQLEETIAAYKPGQGNVDGGGFKIITSDPQKGYIYVQFEALKNGYIDDVEFAVVKGRGDNSVQVRSSSRVGYLDFGVNAKRVNYIAKMMSEKGWKADGVEYATHKGYYLENQVSP
jgi:uncharacterized protein (DUF1499 family)